VAKRTAFFRIVFTSNGLHAKIRPPGQTTFPRTFQCVTGPGLLIFLVRLRVFRFPPALPEALGARVLGPSEPRASPPPPPTFPPPALESSNAGIAGFGHCDSKNRRENLRGGPLGFEASRTFPRRMPPPRRPFRQILKEPIFSQIEPLGKFIKIREPPKSFFSPCKVPKGPDAPPRFSFPLRMRCPVLFQLFESAEGWSPRSRLWDAVFPHSPFFWQRPHPRPAHAISILCSCP